MPNALPRATPAKLALAAALAFTAAPIWAQSFISPDCPTGSLRVNSACVAANGSVVKRFDIPQIDGTRVYDLRADGTASGTDAPESVVIEENSHFVTGLHSKLTVIAD
ncbi:MAG: hypothetical protein JXQ91_01490 [Vannielia sp.]|uniref:hypothetical protein n=1 Tax=Vannielia sp. TaxID=2813045 RepID=UPI003B8BE934